MSDAINGNMSVSNVQTGRTETFVDKLIKKNDKPYEYAQQGGAFMAINSVFTYTKTA